MERYLRAKSHLGTLKYTSGRVIALQLQQMIENGSDITLENALNATNSVTLRTLRKPNVVDLPPGPVRPCDLPLKDLDENAKVRQRLRHHWSP